MSVALAACGSGGAQVSAASDEPRGPADPSAVVARIGSYAISGAMFDRFLTTTLSELTSEPLVPPQFTACVARIEGESTAIGEHAPASSQVKGECESRYRALAQVALERLISDEWLIGGASELDVPVGGQQTLETRAKLSLAGITRTVEERVRPVTRGQVTSYYRQHRFEYLQEAERDLEIARTATWASAAEVKAEIESGKSFASVVRKLPIEQPIDSSSGLVLDLQPHVYGEPNLNQAIFTARPDVLTGPIDTWFGYFVFEVTRIRSEVETPLTHVEASIRQQLARPPLERALAAFGKLWAETWAARTDSAPGTLFPNVASSRACRWRRPKLRRRSERFLRFAGRPHVAVVADPSP